MRLGTYHDVVPNALVTLNGILAVPVNYNYAINLSVLTDSNGEYVFPNLPDGDMKISFQGDYGGVPLGSQDWGAMPFGYGTPIHLSGGVAFNAGEVDLAYAGKIDVTVSSLQLTAADYAPGRVTAYLYMYLADTSQWVRVSNVGITGAGVSASFGRLLVGYYYYVSVTYDGPKGFAASYSPDYFLDYSPDRGPTSSFSTSLALPLNFDFSGDGLTDVLARDSAGGLYLYGSNGASGWAGSAKVGTGWNGFNRVFNVGDFSGDGFADVMARTPSGDLYLYRGNGAGGWLGGAKIGTGWGLFNLVYGAGDFNGDGFPDVMGRTPSGDLYVYYGNGAGGWASSAKIGTGWALFNTVFGVGDFSGDGFADVMARTPSGDLYLYRGDGAGGWLGGARVGTGWNGFDTVFSVGDFGGDGLADVMARTFSGDLYLYSGDGLSGWAGATKIGNGWGPLSIVG